MASKFHEEPRWIEWVGPLPPVTFTEGPQRFTFVERPEHGYRRVEFVKYGRAENLCHMWPGRVVIYNPHDQDQIDINMRLWIAHNRGETLKFLESLADLSVRDIARLIIIKGEDGSRTFSPVMKEATANDGSAVADAHDPDTTPVETAPDATLEAQPADADAVHDSTTDAPGDGEATLAADTASVSTQEDATEKSDAPPLVDKAAAWRDKNRKPKP